MKLRIYETDNEAGNAAGNYPAPPYRPILNTVRQRMSDECNQSARDRSEQSGEKCADAVCGLNVGCLLYTSDAADE